MNNQNKLIRPRMWDICSWRNYDLIKLVDIPSTTFYDGSCSLGCSIWWIWSSRSIRNLVGLLIILCCYLLLQIMTYVFSSTYAERLWTTMVINNILQGNISWQWPSCYCVWFVWEFTCWHIGSWACSTIWCCFVLSCYWHGNHIIFMDRELWRSFWEQGLAYTIQGCCCGHCFW